MPEYEKTILKEILPFVEMPGQYVGGEYNSIQKNWDDADIKTALAFPDLYRIGMSNLGIQILYSIINNRQDALAERVFAPWPDMEQQLRQKKVPLFSLESLKPVGNFDIIGFSVHTETCFTNILNMLDLAGIPLKRKDRGKGDPLVCCGGHNSNYEPIADFIDFAFIGEAEEAINEIIDHVREIGTGNREDLFAGLEKIKGVYIPSFFNVAYSSKGIISDISCSGTKPEIKRRIVPDLNNAPFPDKPIVPNVRVVHDRAGVQIMRGCPNNCRYCKSGNYSRRVRKRDADLIFDLCKRSFEATGYDDISLLSLSTGDYPGITELLKRLSEYFTERHVSLSVPSLSVSEKVMKILPQLKAVRKSGLTFAPETGSEELRKLQNKKITDKDIYRFSTEAYKKGWNHVKLYFMVGLPGETDADVDEITHMAYRVSDSAKESGKRPGKVNMTISPFIPKPFSPFQWESMNDTDQLDEKIRKVTSSIRRKSIRYKYPETAISRLEGLLSRGDRRLGPVIEKAWRNGARFDGWNEQFNPEAWSDALSSESIKYEFYTERKRELDEILPWSRIKTGCEDYILEEYKKFCRENKRRKI